MKSRHKAAVAIEALLSGLDVELSPGQKCKLDGNLLCAKVTTIGHGGQEEPKLIAVDCPLSVFLMTAEQMADNDVDNLVERLNKKEIEETDTESN